MNFLDLYNLYLTPAHLRPILFITYSLLTLFVFILLAECWDCVATSYFIDTAHNVLAYIENIYKILKPGGFWINLGKKWSVNFVSLCQKGHMNIDEMM